MKTIRFAERNWRPDAATLISAGDYRIPEDMPEELAQRALSEGVAELLSDEAAPQPTPKARKAKAPGSE